MLVLRYKQVVESGQKVPPAYTHFTCCLPCWKIILDHSIGLDRVNEMDDDWWNGIQSYVPNCLEWFGMEREIYKLGIAKVTVSGNQPTKPMLLRDQLPIFWLCWWRAPAAEAMRQCLFFLVYHYGQKQREKHVLKRILRKVYLFCGHGACKISVW